MLKTTAGPLDFTVMSDAGTFHLRATKERDRLLIRKQIEVHPRITLLARWFFGLFGFSVTKDATLYYGISSGCECPIALGFHYGYCEGEGDDGEDAG